MNPYQVVGIIAASILAFTAIVVALVWLGLSLLVAFLGVYVVTLWFMIGMQKRAQQSLAYREQRRSPFARQFIGEVDFNADGVVHEALTLENSEALWGNPDIDFDASENAAAHELGQTAHASTAHGNATQGILKQGSLKQGSLKQGSVKQGSVKQGSVSQGSATSGRTRNKRALAQSSQRQMNIRSNRVRKSMVGARTSLVSATEQL